MTKKILNKESVFKDLKLHAKDVGSSEVQIAILTERIRYLTEHFTKNKKDKHSYTGLTTLYVSEASFPKLFGMDRTTLKL